MTRYVNEYKTAAELAAALLTEAGVLIPAHRGDGPLAAFIREQRITVRDIADRIPARVFQDATAISGIDPCEAGAMLNRARQHAAAQMARDLFADWCEVAA